MDGVVDDEDGAAARSRSFSPSGKKKRFSLSLGGKKSSFSSLGTQTLSSLGNKNRTKSTDEAPPKQRGSFSSLGSKNRTKSTEEPPKSPSSSRSSRMSLSSIKAILSPRQLGKLRSSVSVASNNSTKSGGDQVVGDTNKKKSRLSSLLPFSPAVVTDNDNDNIDQQQVASNEGRKKKRKKKKKKQKNPQMDHIPKSFRPHNYDEAEEEEEEEESEYSEDSEEEGSFESQEYEEEMNDNESSRRAGARHRTVLLSSDDDDTDDDDDDDNEPNNRRSRSIPRRTVYHDSHSLPHRRSSEPYMDPRAQKMQMMDRHSASNLREASSRVRPEEWKPKVIGEGGMIHFVGPDGMKTKWEPATSAGGGGQNKKDMELSGDEEFRIVYVFKKPPQGKSLPPVESNNDDSENGGGKKFRGIWATEGPPGPNPTEVWLFHMNDKPDGLEGSTALYGFWGFNPDVTVEDDNFDPQDLWIYPPGAIVPNRVETLGVWMYPRMNVKTTSITAGSAGFLDLVKTPKVGKLGVGGMWKLHYSKEDQDPPEEKKEPKKIFQVKVMTWNKRDEMVTLFPLKGTDTVWDVRCKLAKKNPDLPSDQSLLMNGEVLEDDVTLQDYGIGHNTVLEMEGMKLYIQDWDQRFFEIRVAPDDTVAMTKELISSLINVPPPMLRISFEKALLSKENGELQRYGVHHFARLKLEPIQLFLQQANHKEPIKVPVRPVDSIHQVKQRVSQKLNVPLNTPHIRLYLEDGTELLEGLYLMDYRRVQQGTILRMSAFCISIEDPDTGETCQVEVAEGATVGDVKFAYLELTGIPIAHQNLYFQQTGPLNSAKKLSDYQITSGAVLSLLTLPEFEIEVVSEDGETVRMIADPTDLLDDLKSQIQELFGIPATKQVIRLRKRRLKGNLSLAEYGIKDGGSVEVVRVKTFS